MLADEKFNLTRPVKEIFHVMNILINLSPKSKVYDKHYKELVDDAIVYQKSPTLQNEFKDLLSYINYLYSDKDHAIKSAIGTIRKHGRQNIREAYYYAEKCEKSKDYALTLTTAHSSKGLTFDSVLLSDDFGLEEILKKAKEVWTPEELEELRLYYVAISRARVELLNAKYC